MKITIYGWSTSEFESGDMLLAPDGDLVPVVAIRDYPAYREVRNLTVGKSHTYHVLVDDAFSDVSGYEAAVNGRGVPDLDLTSCGKERARDLARRGYAFSWMALFLLNGAPGSPAATAYVSITPRDLVEGASYTGSVTFVTAHPGEAPFVDDIRALRQVRCSCWRRRSAMRNFLSWPNETFRVTTRRVE